MKNNKLSIVLIACCGVAAIVFAVAERIRQPAGQPLTHNHANTERHSAASPEVARDQALQNQPAAQRGSLAHDARHKHGQHTHGEHPVPDDKLEQMIQRHITPEMRVAINHMLMPNGKPPSVIETSNGLALDLSDRTSSVIVSFYDQGQTIVTDFTHPFPDATLPTNRPANQLTRANTAGAVN